MLSIAVMLQAKLRLSRCKRLASPSEIDEEVVSYYCTNCLEVLPQSAVTAHKGR